MSLRRRLFGISERALQERVTFFGGGSSAHGPVLEVARAFARGYHHVLEHGTASVLAAARREDWYFQPFFAEGAAMGIGPRRLLGRGGDGDVERLAAADPRFQHVLYAGWGWWLARAPGTAAMSARRVRRLHPTLGAIAFDGWGFAAGFFRRSQDAGSVRCPFPEGARRRIWCQGLGRSLLFTAGARPERIERELACRGDAERAELCAGLGLGLAFLRFPDLTPCPPPPVPMAGRARAAFEQGVGFGLAARARAHPEEFGTWRSGLPAGERRWVDALGAFTAAPPATAAGPCEQQYVSWIDALRDRLEAEAEAALRRAAR